MKRIERHIVDILRAGMPLMMFLLAFSSSTVAQEQKKERKGEFYLSWGYNTEWYTHSDIHVSQPSMNNDYKFVDVYGHDYRGWDNQLLEKGLTIPQYNYRIGYFFNKKKNLAIEINFDHTKFIFSDKNNFYQEKAHLVGTVNGRNVDTMLNFAWPQFVYYLNNGANFLCFNIVKRWNVWQNKKETIKVDGLLKGGLGPVVPHVQNTFFGMENKPHFQIGGWNVGVEGAIKVTFFNTVFLEYTNKLDYARYSGLKIYNGTASQAFGCYEMVVNLGLSFPIGKRME